MDNRERPCWALETVVDEFSYLFPETGKWYSAYTPRNVATTVTFDLTPLTDEDRQTAKTLLYLLDADPRVAGVWTGTDKNPSGDAVAETVSVSMHTNPRTMDLRDPFYLGDAFVTLVDDDEGVFDGGDTYETSSDTLDGGGA